MAQIDSIVPSDSLKTNTIVHDKLKIGTLTVQSTAQSINAQCKTLNISGSLNIVETNAKIAVFDFTPIDIDISVALPALNLSLNDNISKYVSLTNTVYLQAEIYIGNPPALTAGTPFVIAQIPINYAPSFEQTFFGNIPMYNADPPLPFASQIALKLDTNGQLTLMFLSGIIGYLKIPIQLSYRI